MGELHVKRMAALTCPHCHAEVDGGDLRPFETTRCPYCGGETEVPASFGPYLLQSMVRKDDFSAAFRALDTVLERSVALRIIIDNEDVAKLNQLKEQVRQLAAINHEHVAAIYKIEKHENHICVESELMTGGTLRELLTSAGRLEVEEAMDIIHAVASGLHSCHEQSLFHGAIGLDRLWLDHNGLVKIADFIGDRLRRRSGRIADLQTAAPELIAAARRNEADQCHSAEIDIYALGVVLYQLVTGKPPFPSSLKDCVEAKGQPAPPIEGHPELSTLIARMTALNPQDRPDDFKTVIELLDEYLWGSDAESSSLSELATEVRHNVSGWQATALKNEPDPDTDMDDTSAPDSGTASYSDMQKVREVARLAAESHQATLSTVMKPSDINLKETAWTVVASHDSPDDQVAYEEYERRSYEMNTYGGSLASEDRRRSNISSLLLVVGSIFISGPLIFFLLLGRQTDEVPNAQPVSQAQSQGIQNAPDQGPPLDRPVQEPEAFIRRLNFGVTRRVKVAGQTWMPVKSRSKAGEGYVGGRFRSISEDRLNNFKNTSEILTKTVLRDIKSVHIKAPRGYRYQIRLEFWDPWPAKKRAFDIDIEGSNVVKALKLPVGGKSTKRVFVVDLKDDMIDIQFKRRTHQKPVVSSLVVRRITE